MTDLNESSIDELSAARQEYQDEITSSLQALDQINSSIESVENTIDSYQDQLNCLHTAQQAYSKFIDLIKGRIATIDKTIEENGAEDPFKLLSEKSFHPGDVLIATYSYFKNGIEYTAAFVRTPSGEWFGKPLRVDGSNTEELVHFLRGKDVKRLFLVHSDSETIESFI